jgi:hypothetical protein
MAGLERTELLRNDRYNKTKIKEGQIAEVTEATKTGRCCYITVDPATPAP